MIRMASAGLRVRGYGPPLPLWRLAGIERLHAGKYLVQEDKSRVFGEALVALNTMHFTEGDALNCRAFEIAGAGGLQLIEHRPAIQECFDPGKELLVYSTFEELLEHVERVQHDERLVAAVRAAGAARAHAEHTYKRRLTRMFALIGEPPRA
jgi:spore maturation protein CgeB